MPQNKKEKLIYGVIMCLIMAGLMSFINISKNIGFNDDLVLAYFINFPIVFVIAYLIQNLIISKIAFKISSFIVKKTRQKSKFGIFNGISIVTMMSLIMTIIGSLVGGENIREILISYPYTWPINFVNALLINFLIATPTSKFVLKKVQTKQLKHA